MSRAHWPEETPDTDVGSPRLYDAGAVEDWVDILVARRSSLLLCGDDSALDRQAQLLLQGLRKAGGVETALIFDMDRSLLLERFNRLLSDMTVDQARAAAPGVARVWVFQVQADAELDQARLLLRLSQDLPGAGVVVLLLASVRLARELAPEGSGRRLQVRVIGDPWARSGGPEEPGAARQEPPMVPPSAASASASASASATTPAPKRGTKLRTTVLAGVALLLASAGAVIFLRPAELRLALGPVAKPAAAASAVAPEASAPASAVAQALPAPATASASAAQAVAVAPAAAASAPALKPAPAPGPVAAVPPGQPQPAAAGTTVPAAAGKSLPPTGDAVAWEREQVARTASWIDAQPESSYLVQHAVSGRASDLLDLRRSQPALADARIIATFRSDGRVYFALVSGPFDSAADARSFEQGLPKLATPGFVRSISRVKRELVEPTSPNVPGLPPVAR
jgi:hypothetical protein